jgi:hypothetical protein
MVIKIYSQAFERFPQKLVVELETFFKRNSLSGGICKRCFKAHALKKAKELKINGKELCRLKKMFKARTGHMGYYLDDNELIKID